MGEAVGGAVGGSVAGSGGSLVTGDPGVSVVWDIPASGKLQAESRRKRIEMEIRVLMGFIVIAFTFNIMG